MGSGADGVCVCKYSFIIQDAETRSINAQKLLLAKFKKSLADYSGKDTSKFAVKIKDVITAKQDKTQKEEIEAEKKKAVAEALAKAAADGEGGLMRRFFS